jgi:putative hydrolase of the HAD superfamily
MTTVASDGETLVIDGDDTLWENNVFYERAIEVFLDELTHTGLSRAEMREVLDRVERDTISVHGYGVEGFGRSLVDCYAVLSSGTVVEADRERLLAIAAGIADQPVVLIEGVRETLTALAGRHPLILLTKGHPDEQARKVERSGLAPLFATVEIPAEKDVETYRSLAYRHGLREERTWMIGNSPRSDILPALEAGLNAVLIPHPETWRLEHAPVPDGHDRLLVLQRFSELLDRF